MLCPSNARDTHKKSPMIISRAYDQVVELHKPCSRELLRRLYSFCSKFRMPLKPCRRPCGGCKCLEKRPSLDVDGV
jgi:hypothetical protein